MRSDPELATAIVEKLKAEKSERDGPEFIRGLFLPQQKFFADKSKKKAAVCGRRAGKSDGIAAWLYEGGLDDPGGLSLYIALSRNLCRLIMWRALTALDQRHSLGLKFTEEDNQLVVVLPNKHRIWLAGCKDSAEVDKFRGPFYRRVAIDEAQSYGPYIKELVEEVIEPALVDLNGELALTGTPAPVPAGYFYEVTDGRGSANEGAVKWSTHHWTLVQNPHIQLRDVPEELRVAEVESANERGYQNERAIAYLDNKLESNRWDRNHPTFRREWLGEWVRDQEALVYPYNPDLNHFSARPENPEDRWEAVMGIDVGYEDAMAWVIGMMRRGHPEIYIVYAEKREHMIPSRMAAYTEKLMKQFKIGHAVIDSGGLGKGYAEEYNQRFSLTLENAEKTKKRAFIEIVYGELVSGNIKIDPNAAGELVYEMNRLVWNEAKTEPDSRFQDHACDAFLYCVRAMYTNYRPQIVRPPLSHEEEMRLVVKAHKEKVMKQIQRNMRRQLRNGSAQVTRDIASGKDIW